MSEIYFIRHGQASFGADDYDKLSLIGERQSRILARHLYRLGTPFDAVYCGNMRRQVDTAAPVIDYFRKQGAQIADPEIMDEFNEYDSASLIAARARLMQDSRDEAPLPTEEIRKDKKAFQAFFAETVYHWADGGFDGIEGMETWELFCDRVGRGVENIMDKNGRGRRVAVFTSGGPISAILKMALDLSNRVTVSASWQILNASITCLKYNSRGFMLWWFNNATHLMLENDPALLTYR